MWNNEKGGYEVEVRGHGNGNDIDDYCDILINAGGNLNAWKWPAISGIEKNNRTAHTHCQLKFID